MSKHTGVSMGGSLVYTHKEKSSKCVSCCDCIYLSNVPIGNGKGNKAPYRCSLKNKPRHYTSKCYCKKFTSKYADDENKKK